LAAEVVAQLHRDAADLEVGGLSLHDASLACKMHAGGYFVGKSTCCPMTGRPSPAPRSSGASLLPTSDGRTLFSYTPRAASYCAIWSVGIGAFVAALMRALSVVGSANAPSVGFIAASFLIAEICVGTKVDP